MCLFACLCVCVGVCVSVYVCVFVSVIGVKNPLKKYSPFNQRRLITHMADKRLVDRIVCVCVCVCVFVRA